MARYGLDYAALLRAQPAPGLLLDHRLRPDRPLPRARRLRLHDPGHGRADERDRRARRRRPAAGRRRSASRVADLFTGMYATMAILAALRHRDRTGQGQHIDMALLDTQVAMLANLGANYLATGRRRSAPATRTRTSCPTRCSRSPDGHIILAVGNDGQFARFCDVAGCPRAGRRPALREQPRPRAPPRRRWCRCWRRVLKRRSRAPTGSARSRRPRCRAARSTTWPRCSPTRRCRRAACGRRCRTRSPARCGWSPAR